MIVGGQTEARAQLSSTIIDYHEPFDQGFNVVIVGFRREVLKWLAQEAVRFIDVWL